MRDGAGFCASAIRPLDATHMAGRFDHLPNRRALVDRRALTEALLALPDGAAPAMRAAAVGLLKQALAAGRDEIARRLTLQPSRGLDAAPMPVPI